jgi:hypothetical protein
VAVAVAEAWHAEWDELRAYTVYNISTASELARRATTGYRFAVLNIIDDIELVPRSGDADPALKLKETADRDRKILLYGASRRSHSACHRHSGHHVSRATDFLRVAGGTNTGVCVCERAGGHSAKVVANGSCACDDTTQATASTTRASTAGSTQGTTAASFACTARHGCTCTASSSKMATTPRREDVW